MSGGQQMDSENFRLRLECFPVRGRLRLRLREIPEPALDSTGTSAHGYGSSTKIWNAERRCVQFRHYHAGDSVSGVTFLRDLIAQRYGMMEY